MLYSRHEIVELVQAQPKELQSTLIAMIWFASKGNPNEVNGDRYGLLQIDPAQAKAVVGYIDHPNYLLEPSLNILIGRQMLQRIGLVEFAGRNLAPQLPAIIALAAFLDAEPISTAAYPSR